MSDLDEEAQLDTYEAWTKMRPSRGTNSAGWTFRDIAQRMFAAHLAVLSTPWEVITHGGMNYAPACPGCGCRPEERHIVDEQAYGTWRCPWLIAARACGISD